MGTRPPSPKIPFQEGDDGDFPQGDGRDVTLRVRPRVPGVPLRGAYRSCRISATRVIATPDQRAPVGLATRGALSTPES